MDIENYFIEQNYALNHILMGRGLLRKVHAKEYPYLAQWPC